MVECSSYWQRSLPPGSMARGQSPRIGSTRISAERTRPTRIGSATARQEPQQYCAGCRSINQPGVRPRSVTGSRATDAIRSEEHTSELQSLMRISYAVFCLKKKKKKQDNTYHIH